MKKTPNEPTICFNRVQIVKVEMEVLEPYVFYDDYMQNKMYQLRYFPTETIQMIWKAFI